MAEQKNLILKLKLETDISSGDKLVKIIKDQVTNTTAIITETEKLKKAEQDRVTQAAANEKRLSEIGKESLKVKKEHYNIAIDFIKSYKDKLAESNALIEAQGRGWGLVESRLQAVLTKYNLTQASQTNAKLNELALEKSIIDQENRKIALANSLASAQQRITTAYTNQLAILQAQAALSSKGYSFASNAENITPTSRYAAGTGASAATSQTQGGYGFGTSETVKANAAKAAKELADINRKNIQDELAIGTAAAKKLYDIRIDSFNAAMTQQESAMRHSVAIQVAVQTQGVNSIQAIRARAAQAEYQLEERYQAQLAAIRRSVASGATPVSAGNSAMVAATNVHTQALATNRVQLTQQENALNTNATAHENLFMRVGKAIGAYRIWNMVINLVTTSMQAIPKIGIEMESTIASLTATTGSASGMVNTMAALENEARRTGIAIGTLRETFRGFQASTSLAGETMQSTWHMFTDLNTVITGLHLPADKASGIFLAMAQIFNKTKVQSEELVKQLGNLLPGAFASFAAANNVAFGGQFKNSIDLINQMKKGTVFAHETVEKFTSFMAERFAPAFALASQGLNATIGRMGTSFTLLGEAAYKSISGPIIGVVKAITNLADYFKGAIEGTNNFGAVIVKVFNIVGAVAVFALLKLIASLATSTAAFVASTGAITAETAAKIRAITINYAFIASVAGITVTAEAAAIATSSMTFAVQASSIAMTAFEAAAAFLLSPVGIIAGIALIALEFWGISKASNKALIDADEFISQTKENLNKAAEKPTILDLQINADPLVKGAKERIEALEKTVKEAEEKIASGKGFTIHDNLFALKEKVIQAKNKLEELYPTLAKLKDDAMIVLSVDTNQAMKEMGLAAEKMHVLALQAQGFTEEAAKVTFVTTHAEDLKKAQAIVGVLDKVGTSIEAITNYGNPLENVKDLSNSVSKNLVAANESEIEKLRLKAAQGIPVTTDLKKNKEFQDIQDKVAAYDKAADFIANYDIAVNVTALKAKQAQEDKYAKNVLDIKKAANDKGESLASAVAEAEYGARKKQLDQLSILNSQDTEINRRTKKSPEDIQQLSVNAALRLESEKGIQVAINDATDAFNKAQASKAKSAASEQNKALKLSYKDSERDIKYSIEITKLALDDLAVAYADNSISISEYYKRKEELQLKNIANEKAIKQAELATATKGGDKAAMAKLEDEIKLLDVTAKRIQPAIAKDQNKDVLAYSNSLAQLNIDYLNLAGATAAATVAQDALNTAQKRKQLDTAIKGGGVEAPVAKQELAVMDTSSAITKINATAEAAKAYRTQINEIQSAYQSMGATSNDVLSATLGGYAPLLNLFDNFMAKQKDMINKMVELKAEADTLAKTNVQLVKAPDTEINKLALEANTKNIEVNRKKQEVLEKQATADKISNITNVFAIGEKMATKGSKTQQIMHKATMVMSGIELATKITTMALDTAMFVKRLAMHGQEMAADAMALPGKVMLAISNLFAEGGWAGFAGAAAFLAILGGSVAMAAGAGGGGGGGEPAPSNSPTGQGGVLGDSQAVSESIGHTNDLLTNIHADEYIELKGINKGIQTLQGNILRAITKQFQLGAIQGTNAPKLGQSGYTVVAGGIHTENITMSDLMKKVDIVGDMFITTAKKGGTKEKPTFSYKDTYSEMPKALKDSLSDVFQSISLTVSELGAKLGKNIGVDLSKKVNAAIIPGLKIDTLGLSGEEAVKKANAVISANLDEVTSYLFGDIVAKYQELGEGMLETTARIVEQVAVVRVAYEAVGSTLIKNSIAISDALINASSSALKASDRIEEFLKQENAFYSSFTSDVTKNIDVLKQFSMTLTEVFDVGLTKATSSIVNAAPDKAYAKSVENYGTRESGAAKGSGFFGELKVPDSKKSKGMIATENTIGVQIAGIEIEVPSLIKGLSALEKATVLSSISTGKLLSNKLVTKISDLATSRLAEGKSVFAKNPMPVYSQYTGGKTRKEDLAAYTGSLKERATETKITSILSPTTVNLKAYTKAQEEYDYVVKNGKPKLKSLSETFFDTYKSTNDLTETISKLKTQIDLTTPAGIKAFAAVNKIKDAFSSLVAKIQKPVKDAITSIMEDTNTLTKEQLLTKMSRTTNYEEIKKDSAATLKLIVDKYNTEKGLLNSLKTTIQSTLTIIEDRLNPVGQTETALRATVNDTSLEPAERQKAATKLVKLITDRYNLERGYITGITDMLKSNAAIIVNDMGIQTEKGLLEEYNNAKTLKDYKAQASISTKLQKLIMDKYTAEKNNILSIKKSFVDLGKTVKDLLAGALSILNPKQKLDLAKAEYETLKAQSQSSDLTVAAEAASKLGDASTKYLTEAMSYYGATANYSQIFKEVTGSLTAISTSAMTTDAGSLAAIEKLGAGALMSLGALEGIGALGIETLGLAAIKNIADLGTSTAATLFGVSETDIAAMTGVSTTVIDSANALTIDALSSIKDLKDSSVETLKTLDANAYTDLQNLGVTVTNILATLATNAMTDLSDLSTNITSAITNMIVMQNMNAATTANVKSTHLGLDLTASGQKFTATGSTTQAQIATNQTETLQTQIDTLKVRVANYKNATGPKAKAAIQVNIDKSLASITSTLTKLGNPATYKALLTSVKMINGTSLLKAVQAKKVPGYANGGIASGLSLVGERGPELVNFPSSTRVTNNNRTNAILQDSNKESLNILTDMKKELIILNNRMETMERKTRLTKQTMSIA